MKKKKNIIQLVSDFFVLTREHHINAYASNVAFYMLLSIFPFIVGIIEIFRITTFQSPFFQKRFWAWIPSDIFNLVSDIADNLSQSHTDMIIPFAIIIVLWASSNGTMALIQGLKISYNQELKHNFIISRIFAFIYTIAFVIIIFLTGFILVFDQIIINFIEKHFERLLPFQNYITKYLIPFILLILMISLIYFSIVRKEYKFTEILPGSLFATLSFMISAYFMSLYIRFSKNLSYMYGSLTSVAVLMIWLNLCSRFILYGAEINSCIHNMKTGKNEENKTPEKENPNDSAALKYKEQADNVTEKVMAGIDSIKEQVDKAAAKVNFHSEVKTGEENSKNASGEESPEATEKSEISNTKEDVENPGKIRISEND